MAAMRNLRRNLGTLAALGAGFAAGMLLIHWAFPARGVPRGLEETRSISPWSVSPDSIWDVALGATPRFKDVTRAAGISFRHENGMTGKRYYPEIMGGGVGLFDANGDGYLDIYLVNGNRLEGAPSPDIKNRLYRNNGDWTFADITDRAGVGDTGYGQGCCAGDYDNDGDIDLFVSNFGPDVLYRNNGEGTFTAVTREAGVEDPGWGQTSSFLDYDGDGWLDLYVQNYMTFSLEKSVEAFIYVGEEKVLDYPSPLAYPGAPSHLYRNNRDGTFRDVTQEAGFFRPDGKGMGCACIDLNGDRRPDIFVANDTLENYLFLNQGNGTFREAGLETGVAYDDGGIPEASMGVDVADFDRDGLMDLIVPCLRKQIFTLYRNRGEYFEDVSYPAGLARATSDKTGFSVNFLDYDNDGDLDLFFTNGGVRTSEMARPDASYTERYGQETLLLANDGKGHYTDVSRWAGPYFAERLIGRGSATGDLDNDGDLDLVISNLADRAVVLRNDTASGHWITLKLIPSKGNRDALGTTVRIEAGGIRQTGAVHGGVSYLSQNDRRVHFGLGSAERVARIEVVWPDGSSEVFEDVAADRFLTLEQGKPAPR
jgi:enediyne biosynthesis protein E4